MMVQISICVPIYAPPHFRESNVGKLPFESFQESGALGMDPKQQDPLKKDPEIGSPMDRNSQIFPMIILILNLPAINPKPL